MGRRKEEESFLVKNWNIFISQKETHTHTHTHIYIGSGPNREEFVGSQCQNHFLDLGRRRV